MVSLLNMYANHIKQRFYAFLQTNCRDEAAIDVNRNCCGQVTDCIAFFLTVCFSD